MEATSGLRLLLLTPPPAWGVSVIGADAPAEVVSLGVENCPLRGPDHYLLGFTLLVWWLADDLSLDKVKGFWGARCPVPMS